MAPRELSVKVCLLGDFAVGKTSLVRRFVYNTFDERYLATIGVRVSRASVVLPVGEEIVALTIMLWDLAGSEEFDRVRASYLRGASGALIVCDLSRPETCTRLPEYVAQLHTVSPDAKVAFLGNKVDLIEDRELGAQGVARLAGAFGAPYHLTSAKTGEGVEEAFRDLGRQLVH